MVSGLVRSSAGMLWWLIALCVAHGVASGVLAADLPQSGRVAWTTSRFVGSPDPPPRYLEQRVFPLLQFDHCLDLARMPGSDRLWVAEQGGKIHSFVPRTDVSQSDLVVDLARGLPGVTAVYALAFHPRFIENRQLFVCCVLQDGAPDGTRIVRFRVNETEPPTLDLASETTIISWRGGGHNGCCLKFGPDGYLYISTGDGTGPNPPDTLRAGQDVTNVLSAILRIDVDQPALPNNYRIPPDNPFREMAGARGEIWAYGLRNPWRMSFDARTGDLWVGDVGWELWEMLHRIERGGNYGWSVMEGRQPTNPNWPRGPTPILPPTIEHPHSESSSITDGLTYFGQRLPELHGMHLYGDYDTGKIWGFRYQDGKVVDHHELADTTLRLVSFGTDASDEILLLDHVQGTLHQLIPNPQLRESSKFPRRLSETGLYVTLSPLRPATGVAQYTVAAEPWSDHASSERWIGVPDGATIATDGREWRFPTNTVMVKTLSLEKVAGDPQTRQYIETQTLHYDGHEWRPYTYAWNDEQTDAELVEVTGRDRLVEIRDPTAPNGMRHQLWRYASRAECQRCHNPWSGPLLGFRPENLVVHHGKQAANNTNTDDVSSAIGASEMESLFHPHPPELSTDRLVNPHDSEASLEARARSYLHINCAHCHRANAGGAVLSQMQRDLPLHEAALIAARPSQGDFGIRGAEVIAAGDPTRSVLWYRMAKLGGGRMPHIGSSEVDRNGLRLMHRWIEQLDDTLGTGETEPTQQARQHRQRLMQLEAAVEPSQRVTLIDQLLDTTDGALCLVHFIDRSTVAPALRDEVVARAENHANVTVRDLFESFVPHDRRMKRLGNAVIPDQILAMQGDAVRGRNLFWADGAVSCRNCHKIGTEGQDVGPDLSGIGKRLDPRQLLESLLEPSK